MSKLFRLFAVAAVVLGTGSAASAQDASAWQSIMASKTLKVCMPVFPPNAYKDRAGQWQGFSASMAKDVAKTMHVNLEWVETTLKTQVIDLQSGRCDVIFGLVITPERAMAMDFAAPLYYPLMAMASRRGYSLPGKDWASINKPDARTSVVLGNAAEARLNRGAPLSTKVPLGTVNEAVLALQSGRADIYVGNIFEVLAVQAKAPVFQDISIIEDAKPAPSFAGIRYDSDGRFARFLANWAAYARNSGEMQDWVAQALVDTGVDRKLIPSGIAF